MNKKRLKNYGLWVAVASLILMIIQMFGVEIAPEKYDQIVNAILGVLTLLGVISNPTKPNGKGFNL